MGKKVQEKGKKYPISPSISTLSNLRGDSTTFNRVKLIPMDIEIIDSTKSIHT
jgi:hypothetical protein